MSLSGSNLKRKLAGILVASAFGASLSLAQAEPGKVDPDRVDHSQEQLPYRTALYHYYQGQHLHALTELEAGKVRGSTETQADARLLEAGLRLGYGMHRSARGVLTQLLASPLLSETSFASASFYLAQWLYLHEEYAQAKQILDRINAPLPPGQQQQYAYLRQLLSLKLGVPVQISGKQQAQNPEAQDFDQALQQSGPWQPYLLYNMAVAEAAKEQITPALDYLELALSGLPAQDNYAEDWWRTLLFWDNWFSPDGYYMPPAELAALKDKILLAQASLYQREQRYPLAVQSYRQVRQDSPLASQALLGYGWSAYQQGDIKSALSAWQALSKDPSLEAGTLQSYLAIAWTHEQLNKPAAAERHYDFAAEEYQRFKTILSDELASLTPQSLSDALLAQYSRQKRASETTQIGVALAQVLPTVLHGWVPQQSVQVLLQDLDDLAEIETNLKSWQRDLSQFDDMLVTAEAARAEQLAEIDQAAPAARLQQLIQQRDWLSQQILQAGEHQGLHRASNYATRQELEWSKRIDRVRIRLSKLSEDDPRRQKAELRLQRIEGALYWQQQEQFPQRDWMHRKALKQLDQALRDTQGQLVNLQRSAKTPRSFNKSQLRVAEIDHQVSNKVARTQQLKREVSEQLYLSAQRYLQRQIQLVSAYQAQANLALVRLHEQAYQHQHNHRTEERR